ncbi:putative DNA-binding protein [Alkalibacterium sp. 20]|uniref:putative DNA-binding protein n=1 Tax=Alkalibacterium sp. 20 TaxID=1798803 RepID=UPI0008FFEE8F|nr:putative DNA-binding protein [Alkalibacterium sp. 20]OJF96994.1 DNA-binding protein [Alkalibacterium sp. 20]
MELEKTLRLNRLFSFYRPLLTSKQQEYMQLYYGDDYSLGEIADAFSVSRQAVYDNIKRSEAILTNYEEKLHLVEDFEKKQEAVDQLRQYVQEHYKKDAQLLEYIQAINLETLREE